MNASILSMATMGLLGLAISTGALAEKSQPTCDEQPGLRDCVKVEDPEAKPPKPSVHRNPKPGGPAAKPLPAAGGNKAK